MIIHKTKPTRHRYSWRGLLFVLFVPCIGGCIEAEREVPVLTYNTAVGSRLTISYAGSDDFRHGQTLTVGDIIFRHDSTLVINRRNSGDTILLPTQRYPVLAGANGRYLYENVSALGILQLLATRLNKMLVETEYRVNKSAVLSAGKLTITQVGKKAIMIEFPLDYPLKIMVENQEGK